MPSNFSDFATFSGFSRPSMAARSKFFLFCLSGEAPPSQEMIDRGKLSEPRLALLDDKAL